MNRKQFITIASVIFGAGAVVHIARFFLGFAFVIDGLIVPTWASLIIGLVAGYLSYSGFRMKK